MSLGEILVVLLVALLVIKPEDIPAILRKIQQLHISFNNMKKEAYSYFAKEISIDGKPIKDDLEELNFYLEKIISIEGEYKGEYELGELKKKYHELMKIKIEEGKKL